MTVPDTIEREIRIAAPIERVWRLVSEPGWWINEGAIRQHRIEEGDGHVVVHDKRHGAFPIETVELREPVYASFRWLASHDAAHAAEHIPTLVEFTIVPLDGEVLVRVVESGFAAGGDVSDEARRKAFKGNSEGWEIELAAARSHIENA
jgi:uncharacterized protein YndB with AHSA1/START domain